MRNASGRSDADKNVQRLPRFAVLENVPGLLTSNGGEDFRVVLEEMARVAEPSAVVPRYERGGGLTRELLSATDGASHGGCTTLSVGELPKGGVASLWSPISRDYLPRPSCLTAILEPNPDPKYNLSPKACAGILRRAIRRNQVSKMPKILVDALICQSGHTLSEISSTVSFSENPLKP